MYGFIIDLRLFEFDRDLYALVTGSVGLAIAALRCRRGMKGKGKHDVERLGEFV